MTAHLSTVESAEPVWRIPLPYPTPPLTLNGRMHHMARYRHTKQLRGDAKVLALAAHLPKGLVRVEIVLHWQPTTRRPRDEDNLTPTLKPLIDGLVDYGLVPDDDHEHVTSRCRIEPIARFPATWLTITQLEEAA